MGDFSKLTVKAEIDALAATVSGEEVKLQKLVDGLTKRCLALGSIDKANYASTLAVARAITGVLCAGLGFLPLVGPPMLAVVGPVLNAALTTAFTVQDKGKAVTVLQVMAATASTFAKAAVPVAGGLPESVLFHMAAEFGMSRTSADDPKKPATVGGMPAGGFFTTTGSAGGELVAQVAKFEPHLVRPRTGKAKTPSVETAKTATYVVALAKQGMRTGYAWIDQRPDDGVLLPLVFYSLLDQQAAGGRGAQLMETGVIFASGKIDAESMLRPLAQVRDALRRVAGYGTLGHKSSRLIDRLDRWKALGLDGNPQGYANWYFVADAPADRRASVFSSIALEKARILAYVDDYHDSLAGFFGSVFQKEASQGANSQVLPGIQRMPSVFRGGSTGHKYAKASGTNSLQSTHRKAWAVGIYAFHAILRQHLGTYNLAALPAFGANPELDRRVHNALLDALATQWWITAEAYNTGSTAKATDPVVTDNLMTKELLEVPYLKRFYDKERVWQQVGAQEFVFFSAASDSPDANNAYSHEGNQVEGLNLGGARTYLEQPLTGPFAAKIASYWGTKFKSFLDL
ncbi:MAG: hypothetical protein WCI05_14070, partial [Myxococcales bacterium]